MKGFVYVTTTGYEVRVIQTYIEMSKVKERLRLKSWSS